MDVNSLYLMINEIKILNNKIWTDKTDPEECQIHNKINELCNDIEKTLNINSTIKCDHCDSMAIVYCEIGGYMCQYHHQECLNEYECGDDCRVWEVL